MTEPIRFTKMHGAGNDYIYVNTMAFPVRNPEELAIRLSAPHTGIGSDGLVLIGSSKIADFRKFLFVFNLERHKIDTLSCFFSRNDCRKEHCIAHA